MNDSASRDCYQSISFWGLTGKFRLLRLLGKHWLLVLLEKLWLLGTVREASASWTTGKFWLLGTATDALAFGTPR